MRILGIETSCDETAAAVVENGTKILSNFVASSVELHQKTGGIIPEVAAREQIRCIIPVINETIKQSNNLTINNRRRHTEFILASRKILKQVQNDSIDAIAVTIGPGLVGSLLVGIETAKTLAYVWEKPIIPVNHLQAHLYANWLTLEQESKRAGEQELPKFSAIGLVVSGGHTELVLMKTHGQYQWLGGTRDDAAGECFDKTARLLGLGYPGGPAIQKAAQKGNPQTFDLPRPMIKQENFDFSFSGLKTAVLNEVRKKKKPTPTTHPRLTTHNPPPTPIFDLAASIQQAIVDVLIEKTTRAAKKFKVKSVLLAGGVAANQLLRKQMQKKLSILNCKLYIPPLVFCTDNAAIIASCAYFNYKPVSWQKIKVNPVLEIC